MKRKRVTKAGIEESMDEPDWMSPFHLTFPHGVPTASMRSAQDLSALTTGKLTDRKIDKYQREHLYTLRAQFRKELAKRKTLDKVMPRLVYNMTTQEFEEMGP